VRLFTLRGPVLRVPWPLVLLAWGGRGAWEALRWLAVHLWVVSVASAALGLWWVIRSGNGLWLLAAAGGICLTLGGVMNLRPRWWAHLQETAASWRRRRWYEQRWELAVSSAGLIGVEEMPTLISHRFGGAPGERDLDVLTVRMAAGQLVSDWRTASVRLASTWELQRLRAHAVPGQPRDLQLLCRRLGLSPAARERWASRTSQLDVRHMAGAEEPSTAVEEPVEELPPVPRTKPGAFPRTPRSAG